MQRFNRTKMLLNPGVVIFIALTCVLPIFVEGRIILDEGFTNSNIVEDIRDYTPPPRF